MTAINKISHQDIIHFIYKDHDGDSATLDTYQELAVRSAIYPGQGTPLGLAYVALKLNGEAGELAEHVGKAMRDDSLIVDATDNINEVPRNIMFGQLTPERHDALCKELGDILWYVSAAAAELGQDLSEIAAGNLRKLASRAERGTLQGSGDDR